MLFTNEMSRTGAQFEHLQAARSAGIASIRAAVQRDLQRGQTTRDRVMANHQKATKGHLKDIFAATAFIRGAADDLINDFADDHATKATEMRDHLNSFVEELQRTVTGQLEHLNDARATVARHEEAARQAYLKDLRRRVRGVLGNADKYMNALHKERMGANRVWVQHCRTAQRLRKAAANGEAALPKRTPKSKKIKSQKTTRH